MSGGQRPDPEPSGSSVAAICRIAGAPYSALTSLGDSGLLELCATLSSLDQVLGEHRRSISEILHQRIAVEPDRALRNRLLSARRELFTRSEPREKSIQLVVSCLDAPGRTAIAAYLAELSRRARLEQSLSISYAEAAKTARRSLADHVDDEAFRRAVLLSSPTLGQNIDRYRRDALRVINSRLGQIERGLLRYFTRMVAKSTPFSVFCAVVPVSFIEPVEYRRGACAIVIGAPRPVRTLVRLNRRLLQAVWQKLKESPEVRPYLPVELNPSITVTAMTVDFLTSLKGIETFQKLPRLDVLVALISAITGSRRSLKELTDFVGSQMDADATPDAIEAYLTQLLSLGFLRLRHPVVDSVGDWVEPFVEFLSTIGQPLAQRVAALLNAASEAVRSYDVATPSERPAKLEALRTVLRTSLAELEIRDITRDLPLYEDGGADASVVVGKTAEFRQLLHVLTGVLRVSATIRPSRVEHASMSHFFDTRYEPGASIHLLAFYEDYFRAHFKNHLARVQRAKAGDLDEGYDLSNPFKLPHVTALHTARSRLAAALLTRIRADRDAEEIDVPLSELERCVGSLPVPELRSTSVFCEMVLRGGGEVRFCVRQAATHPGDGKYFSRFLDLMSDEFRRAVLDRNSDPPDTIRAELLADSYFNANVHPALVATAVEYPTAEGGVGASSIPIHDLIVTRSAEFPDTLVVKRMSTGERVVPLDLGFLTRTLRPALFQLLAQFAPTGDSHIPVPEPPMRPNVKEVTGIEPPTVRYRPRIVVDGAVVIARRSWFVASAAYPLWRVDENDVTRFRRVSDWRVTHGIPERAYVRIRPGTENPATPLQDTPGTPVAAEDAEMDGRVDDGATIDDSVRKDERDQKRDGESPAVKRQGSGSRISRDHQKPQYIDFSSPLLVELFTRLPTGLSEFRAVIEERYPDDGALLCDERGEAYATELVLETDLSTTTLESNRMESAGAQRV